MAWTDHLALPGRLHERTAADLEPGDATRRAAADQALTLSRVPTTRSLETTPPVELIVVDDQALAHARSFGAMAPGRRGAVRWAGHPRRAI
jgi:hypothetical protein